MVCHNVGRRCSGCVRERGDEGGAEGGFGG